MTLYERYLKFGDPFKRTRDNARKVGDWLRATVDSLAEIQKPINNQAVESLPPDDRQLADGLPRQTQWDVVRDSPPRAREGSPSYRMK